MNSDKVKKNEAKKSLALSPIFFALLAAVVIHLFFAFAFREKQGDEVVKDTAVSRFSVIAKEGMLDLKKFSFSLTYQDPEAFLKGSGGMLAGGTFGNALDPASSPAPVLPETEEKVLLNAPAKKSPVPVPEGYEAAKPLDVSGASIPAPPSGNAVKYPVCTDRNGSVIDVTFDDALLKTGMADTVKKITLLTVSEGIDVDGTKVDPLSVPPETRILVSCGNAKLDALAKRTIDKAVLGNKVKRGTIRVYWNKKILYESVVRKETSSDDEVKK